MLDDGAQAALHRAHLQHKQHALHLMDELQVGGKCWPAWKCVSYAERSSHPGTTTLPLAVSWTDCRWVENYSTTHIQAHQPLPRTLKCTRARGALE